MADRRGAERVWDRAVHLCDADQIDCFSIPPLMPRIPGTIYINASRE
jgi:hypothetical protein